MSPKHTPGPWRLGERPGTGLEVEASLPILPLRDDPRAGDKFPFFVIPRQQVRLHVDGGGKVWGVIAYEEWVQFSQPDFDAMQAANARLIAAAPCLLEACRAAREVLRSCVEPRGGCDDARHLAEARAAVEAAIAKAEGSDVA